MGEVVELFGRVWELPPLVTTADLVVPLNLCDDPIVSGRCAALVYRYGHDRQCDGLLAYQAGRWQHVNVCRDCLGSSEPCPGALGHPSCDDPTPVVCMHGCGEPADIEVQCSNGAEGECDGCCWISDEAEVRRMWPR